MAARYTELAEAFIKDIGSGKLPVGATLPSEVALAAQHGVSRATLRSALQMVQDLGLISRRKRAGIRIEAATPPRAYERSMSNLEDLMQFATMTERRVQSIGPVVCDQALADRLKCNVLTQWLRVELLRIDPADPQRPLCWTDVHLNPAIGKGLRSQLKKSSGLICEMVEEKYGCAVAQVRQEIRAVGLPERVAGKLAAAPDSHALEVTRWYLDQQGAAFEVTVSVFPADRFAYTLLLRRQR